MLANKLVELHVVEAISDEMMAERGLSVDHTTISRSRAARRSRVGEAVSASSASVTNDSWRVDETEVSIKGVWMSLSRAVDFQGDTMEFQSARSS